MSRGQFVGSPLYFVRQLTLIGTTTMYNNIREIYCRYRRAYTGDTDYGRKVMPHLDGGWDQYGNLIEFSVWQSIDRFLQRKQCTDYFGFVGCNFAAVRPRIIEPSELCGESAWKRYHKYRKYLQENLPELFEQEVLELSFGYNKYLKLVKSEQNDEFIPLRAIRLALADRCLNLSPLFRFFCAHNLGFVDLAEIFGEEAQLQYFQASDLYARVYSSQLGDLLCNADFPSRAI